MNRLKSTKQTTANGTTVNKRANYSYNADGSLRAVKRYANDGTTAVDTSTYGYDGMGRLNSLGHVPTGASAINYGYTYDAASRVASMTTPDGTTNSINYDATDQLLGVDYTYQDDEGYTYDANGNRVTANGSGYTTSAGDRLTFDGTYHYSYDAEGNRTFRFVSTDGTLGAGDTDITKYDWDNRNRLTKVSHFTTYANYQTVTTDKVFEYTYDYLDRRILKKADADGSGSGVADYVYNVYQGSNAALEIHDANSLAVSGTGENAPHLAHRYLFGDGADEILASENAAGAVLRGLGDHEGTIRDIVNNPIHEPHPPG